MAVDPRISHSQQQFLLRGGPLEMALQQLEERGQINTEYVYREYPKMLPVPGFPVVNSPEEEERVVAGGATSEKIEEERLSLLARAKQMGLPADPDWSTVRLKREMGIELDRSATPGDEMARLEAELSTLRKMAEMQSEIERLRAQVNGPRDDADTLRAELAALGVKADGRWSVDRLRQELDRVTAPVVAA